MNFVHRYVLKDNVIDQIYSRNAFRNDANEPLLVEKNIEHGAPMVVRKKR
jgi:hypothetical protein